MFRISSCGLSDVGLLRRKNQDLWLQLPFMGFYALADGMGGHNAGEVAAAEAMAALLAAAPGLLADAADADAAQVSLVQLVHHVNQAVWKKSLSTPRCAGMGTTLCCLHLIGNYAQIVNVGDSRLYRLRGGGLQQLTTDDSLFERLVAEGAFLREERARCDQRHVITRAIGLSPLLELSSQREVVHDGDRFLLCSDGLTDMLSKEEITEELLKEQPITDQVEALISAAKQRGGHDNITLLLIAVTSHVPVIAR